MFVLREIGCEHRILMELLWIESIGINIVELWSYATGVCMFLCMLMFN